MPANNSSEIIETSDPQPLLRGWRRMRQLRQQDEAARQAIVADIIDGLGRPTTTVDKIAAEAIAAATVRARRLRLNGHDDSSQTRLLAQLLRTSGFRPAPAAAMKPDPTAQLDAVFDKIAAEREAQS
jgi:hypothetical protein